MNYSRVYLESIAYELAPVVVSSADLERRLGPIYKTLHLQPGQLEALTGIKERRWWNAKFPVSQGATLAAISPSLMKLAAFAIVGGAAGVVLFRRALDEARKEGSLTTW